MQLERLLARQMEILQDAAVQERLQALDWRIPPAALKYLNDAQNTNGAAGAADLSRDSQGWSFQHFSLISDTFSWLSTAPCAQIEGIVFTLCCFLS